MRDARSVRDGIIARLPKVGSLPGSPDLPARRTIFGDPIVGEGAAGPDLPSPLRQATPRNDPVIAEMQRLKVFPGATDRTVLGVELLPRQYEESVTIAGQEAKARLTQRMQSPSWATIPDWKKVEIINDTITETRKLAARRLFAAHSELRQALATKRLEKYKR